MPIYLPPLSRRAFLKQALAAGASLTLPCKLWAESASVDPHAWALLADTHIAMQRTLMARGVNMADNLLAVARDLTALPQRPAAAFITGDCAYLQGEAGDYALLADLLAPVRAAPLSFYLLPGNHDNRAHLAGAFANEAAPTSPPSDRRVAIIHAPRANWFLLDSLEHTNSTPGLLGETQRDWLAGTLDAHADKPAIVVAHHNLDSRSGQATNGLQDSDQVLRLLAPRRHVKAYVFGHTHSWQVTQHDSGLHLINLPPVAYVFDPDKPNGWVLATLQPDGIQLRLNCLAHAHPAHGKTVELNWRNS